MNILAILILGYSIAAVANSDQVELERVNRRLSPLIQKQFNDFTLTERKLFNRLVMVRVKNIKADIFRKYGHYGKR
jgi:hypothetical protein